MAQMTMTLDEFKYLMETDKWLKQEVVKASDIIDMDNGSMIIHRSNLNKYLERYMCKNEDDLKDTLWYNEGIYVKVID